MLLIVLIVSLLFNAVFAAYYITRKIQHYSVQTDVNDSLVTFTYNKIAADAVTYRFFKLLPNDSTDIVFLGDSHTASFALSEMFNTVRTKNRGIGGNTSSDIIKRLDEVTEGRPAKIFLEIGINDLSNGISVDSLLYNVKQISSTIKAQAPLTKLYIHGMFPTAFAQKQLMPKIKDYNRRLEQYCSNKGITFIDVFPSFYDSAQGGLSEALTTDGVHLNEKGYFIWKSLIHDLVFQ